MSRSKRKFPMVWGTRSKKMKNWKNESDRKVRMTLHLVREGKNNNKRLRSIDEIPLGSYYKRFHDGWNSPADGKRWTVRWKKWKQLGK